MPPFSHEWSLQGGWILPQWELCRPSLRLPYLYQQPRGLQEGGPAPSILTACTQLLSPHAPRWEAPGRVAAPGSFLWLQREMREAAPPRLWGEQLLEGKE